MEATNPTLGLNVRNLREHLVLHLANAQMRLTPTPDNIDTLDAAVLRRFRRKLLGNYISWCSYVGKKSSIRISDRRGSPPTTAESCSVYRSISLSGVLKKCSLDHR